MVEKNQKIRDQMSKLDLDGLLISDPYNIYYLSGFQGLAPEERESWILITKDENYFFTDGRYVNQVKSEKLKVKSLQTKLVTPEKTIQMHVQMIAKKEKLEKIGFESGNLTYSEYERFKELVNLVPTDRLIVNIRKYKNQDEIDKIKQACQIGDDVLKDAALIIKPGLTEKNIAQKIIQLIEFHNAEAAFYPIVTSDSGSASPHYNTKQSSRKIQKNSVVLIDFGVKYQNYCSDITRIFFIGKQKDEIITVYQQLLEIQKSTINRLIVLSEAKMIDKFCRESLEKNGLPNFPHSTGHGIGLQVHEYPKISSSSCDTLSKNQVFTIEPGIYFPEKYGLRIEDTILMKENQLQEVLTKFPKEIHLI
ncbi:hypothetical protein A3C23_02365 [Candidatus Roizmanbacteria bacterium RIFCSPHIGHO2_02_FULL_37_13b]|uniref:Peptidase M24 domain-containing protein n=1 Tax=Candidatus Roizmanbacteria bacterium RIFCSPLOWO2_02_FULL_36_11 TaxID=1802071 RepID=A0A1F7JJ07_9BACT|nr:MAG: hypothetical protein A3C23_02365 [Candidatus Roizmanbacteria bacterium RIFCSPHIGHO2_02_FULL_37_13b]OGK55593.1 MAG: hypothetical protein A3H78_01410 [Candidatus Roizmanbacteria bacterium RIFCSPLOWO2_02_FULL_36_11]